MGRMVFERLGYQMIDNRTQGGCTHDLLVRVAKYRVTRSVPRSLSLEAGLDLGL